MAEKRLYRSTQTHSDSYLIEIGDSWIEYDRVTTSETLPPPYELVACISEELFLQAALGRRIKFKSSAI